MPSAVVLACLLSTLAVLSSAEAREQAPANLDHLSGCTRQPLMLRVSSRGKARYTLARLPRIMGACIGTFLDVAGPLHILASSIALVWGTFVCKGLSHKRSCYLVLQEWESRVGRRALGYNGSSPASSGVDPRDDNTAESSRLQPGVNAGLAFTALDETALGAARAASTEITRHVALAPDEALSDGLSSVTSRSIAAEPFEDGVGSISGQGGQAWTPGLAPGPQGATEGYALPEISGKESAARDPSTGSGNSAAYSGNSVGAVFPCDNLQGGPTEWMRHDGALGLACAQQVRGFTIGLVCCAYGSAGVP